MVAGVSIDDRVLADNVPVDIDVREFAEDGVVVLAINLNSIEFGNL